MEQKIKVEVVFLVVIMLLMSGCGFITRSTPTVIPVTPTIVLETPTRIVLPAGVYITMTASPIIPTKVSPTPTRYSPPEFHTAVPTTGYIPPTDNYVPSSNWFSGGTLHKAKVSEWRNATYANRLATSADFIAATQNVDYGDMVGFKQMATDLEACISTTVSGGDVDNEDVVFISSMCTVMLFPK